jgi:hypothetical protein
MGRQNKFKVRNSGCGIGASAAKDFYSTSSYWKIAKVERKSGLEEIKFNIVF